MLALGFDTFRLVSQLCSLPITLFLLLLFLRFQTSLSAFFRVLCETASLIMMTAETGSFQKPY